MAEVERNPILIYQMGKVGSRTVQSSLRPILATQQAMYHLHQLHDLDAVERAYERAEHVSDAQRDYLETGRVVRKRFDAREPYQWDVITLVRDPVRRNLSAFFYGLADEAPGVFEQFCAGRMDHAPLLSRFLHSFDHDFARDWFERQFQPVFGAELCSQAFSSAGGYQIVETERVRLLLLRTEDLDRCLAPALQAFLGFAGLEPKSENRATDKAYAAGYREFLDRVVIPDQYLSWMYDARWVRQCYTPQELESFRRHWTK